MTVEPVVSLSNHSNPAGHTILMFQMAMCLALPRLHTYDRSANQMSFSSPCGCSSVG